MKKILAILFVFIATISFASAASGSIWTTNADCGAKSQDVNHYAVGDVVYVNGAGFGAGLFDWSIVGQPGGASCKPRIVVANGTNFAVGSSGTFCFAAYTIANDDCGEYKATFDNKHDNFRVDAANDVPEFGVVAGALALIGAVGIIAFRRK